MSSPAPKRRAVSRASAVAAIAAPKKKASSSKVVRYADKPRPGDKVFTLTRMIHRAETMVCDTAVTDNGGFQGTGYLAFQFDQLPNYAALAAVFGEYRIKKCVIKFMPRWTNTGSAGTAVNHTMLGWFHDDTGTALAAPYLGTENAWLNRAGYRQVMFNTYSGVDVTSYPSPIVADVSVAGAIEASIGQPSQWISTTNVDLPHYGVKFRVYSPQATSNDTLTTGEIYVQYIIEFRQPL